MHFISAFKRTFSDEFWSIQYRINLRSRTTSSYKTYHPYIHRSLNRQPSSTSDRSRVYIKISDYDLEVCMNEHKSPKIRVGCAISAGI